MFRKAEKTPGPKKQWNKRVLRKGSYSAALSVVFIAIIVVVNMIAAKIPSKYTQLDISTGKLYTIGDETKKVLKALDQDITIYYIVQNGNENTTVEKMLQLYQEQSSHIKVEKIDPVTSPKFTSQYSEDTVSENSLIVTSDKRNKVIGYSDMFVSEIDYSTYQSKVTGFDGEGQLTSAISYVLSDDLPVVYYVEGHNEVTLPDAVVSRIEKANLELKALNLVTADSVPEDAAALLLDSPETDYSKEEATKVKDYLKQGGKAMVLTDYTGNDNQNYNSILEEYGIDVTDGVIVETDQNKYVQRPYYIVPDIGASEITSGMTGGASNVLLSGCQGFKVDENARDTLDISTLLSPSENAFVKTDPKNMTSYDKTDQDEEGPFAVAAAVSEPVSDSSADTESESRTTKLMCIASSSILDASMNSMVSDGNYTLYMNGMNWLVDAADKDRVSIASKSVSVDTLTVTAGKGALTGFVVCIFIPFATLIGGGIFCHGRKKR